MLGKQQVVNIAPVLPATPENPNITHHVAVSPGQGSITQEVHLTKQHGQVTIVVPDPPAKEYQVEHTHRIPYTHPNYGPQQSGNQQIQRHDQGHYYSEYEAFDPKLKQHKSSSFSLDDKRQVAIVKPAKYNIREFEGDDADQWIQTIEQYFDNARTSLEQSIAFAVSYLKGEDVQWWRGTRYNTHTLSWHRFCRHLGDRFSVTSVTKNVKLFHALIQTGTVTQYIQQFEKLLNMLRRDTPSLPKDYFVTSFIAGMCDYIKARLECHKPKDLLTAMWLARRMEIVVPPKKTTFPPFALKTQVNFDIQKTATTNTSLAPNQAVIQEARQNGVCWRCKEVWAPGHTQVCKLTQKLLYKQCKLLLLKTLN